MKVFTAERYYDYEGFQLLGIFTTEEKAQEVIDGDKYGDGHNINEYTIDELTNI